MAQKRGVPTLLSAQGSAALRPSSVRCFFNDTATTEIYTLSLHDALPIYRLRSGSLSSCPPSGPSGRRDARGRSEEHTSELQSRLHLVCRLLLVKNTIVLSHKSALRSCELRRLATPVPPPP